MLELLHLDRSIVLYMNATRIMAGERLQPPVLCRDDRLEALLAVSVHRLKVRRALLSPLGVGELVRRAGVVGVDTLVGHVDGVEADGAAGRARAADVTDGIAAVAGAEE